MAHEYMHAVVFSQKSLKGASGGRQIDGRGGLAGRSDGPPRRGPERVFDVEYRLSRQCVLDAVRNGTSSWWMITTRPTCSAATAAGEVPTCSCGGVLIGTGRICSPHLVHSRLRGAANLEAATGSTFADLYRRWSLALFLSGLEPSRDKAGLPEDGFRSINMRAPCDEWELAGPRFTRVARGWKYAIAGRRWGPAVISRSSKARRRVRSRSRSPVLPRRSFR